MRNAVSNKGEPRKILGGKNLTVARATFATVWIRACYLSTLNATMHNIISITVLKVKV